MQSAEKPKIVKGPDGWKKEPSSEKIIETNPTSSSENKPSNENKPSYTPNIPKPIPKRDNFKPK